MVKENILVAMASMEKEEEMQRQLMDTIWMHNVLLQNVLLLGEQALQSCKTGPSHVLQPPRTILATGISSNSSLP